MLNSRALQVQKMAAKTGAALTKSTLGAATSTAQTIGLLKVLWLKRMEQKNKDVEDMTSVQQRPLRNKPTLHRPPSLSFPLSVSQIRVMDSDTNE